MAKVTPSRTGIKRGARPGVLKVKTKRLRALTERAALAGITPLEYMLGLIRAPELVKHDKESARAFVRRHGHDKEFRLAAARYAAPYVHPRLASTVLNVKTDAADNKPIDVLELAKSVAFLLTMPDHRRTIDVTPLNQSH